MKEQKLRKTIRNIIREDIGRNLPGGKIGSIVNTLLPNAQVERDTEGRIPIGSGEVVTLPNGDEYLVASNLEVFDENGRKTDASRLFEMILKNQVR